MRFMDGFSNELVKLATDVTGSDIRDKPEGETFKGKPTPLSITPKKDIKLIPNLIPEKRSPVALAAPTQTSAQPGPAKTKLTTWSGSGGRGVGVRVPIKLP